MTSAEITSGPEVSSALTSDQDSRTTKGLPQLDSKLPMPPGGDSAYQSLVAAHDVSSWKNMNGHQMDSITQPFYYAFISVVLPIVEAPVVTRLLLAGPQRSP